MVNGIRLISPCRLSKGFGSVRVSKFDLKVPYFNKKVPEFNKKHLKKVEGPKHYVYNNKNDDKSPNIVNDINYQALSPKSRQMDT